MKRDITEVYICGLALDVCVGMSGFGFLFGTFETVHFCRIHIGVPYKLDASSYF